MYSMLLGVVHTVGYFQWYIQLVTSNGANMDSRLLAAVHTVGYIQWHKHGQNGLLAVVHSLFI